MSTLKWVPITFSFTVALFSGIYLLGKKWRSLELKLEELEKCLKVSVHKCAAERQGRIRAQQALRKTLLKQRPDTNLEPTSYPLIPIGTVQSCFSTRYGTPRQPLIVPLARACLMFDPKRVPPASLEGLDEYSHIWIIFVFHLNTDLEKLWSEPSKSKIKAKVRVPKLRGGKKGVFATRSPHRPCPIGLTVAKIEAVQGHMVLLSGVDLVDGTPVLDVKPYLSYCDSIVESTVPEWVEVNSSLTVSSVTFSDGFHSALGKCWELVDNTLYSSQSEMKRLIQQVLSWDIRSSSQRNRPHKIFLKAGNCEPANISQDGENCQDEESFDPLNEQDCPDNVVYHLVLEGLDISYKIDCEGSVLVDTVTLMSDKRQSDHIRCNYTMWKHKFG